MDIRRTFRGTDWRARVEERDGVDAWRHPRGTPGEWSWRRGFIPSWPWRLAASFASGGALGDCLMSSVR